MMTASTAASLGYLTEQPLHQRVSVQTKLTFFPSPRISSLEPRRGLYTWPPRSRCEYRMKFRTLIDERSAGRLHYVTFDRGGELTTKIGSGMVSVVNRVEELRRRARDSPVRFQRSE